MRSKKKSTRREPKLEQKKWDMEKLKAEVELIRREIAHTEAQTKQISKPWWKREPIATLTLLFTVVTSLITGIGSRTKVPDIGITIKPETSQPKEPKPKNSDPWTPKDPSQRDRGLGYSEAQNTVRLADETHYRDLLVDQIEKIVTDAIRRTSDTKDQEQLKAQKIKFLQLLKEQEIDTTGTGFALTAERLSDALDELIKRIERS